jgi:hypothetical protein
MRWCVCVSDPEPYEELASKHMEECILADRERLLSVLSKREYDTIFCSTFEHMYLGWTSRVSQNNVAEHLAISGCIPSPFGHAKPRLFLYLSENLLIRITAESYAGDSAPTIDSDRNCVRRSFDRSQDWSARGTLRQPSTAFCLGWHCLNKGRHVAIHWKSILLEWFCECYSPHG